MFIVLAMAGVAAALYGPKWLDFLEMKEIARASAAEWHVTDNMSKTKAHFALMLEEREIPYYIPDNACSFSKGNGTRTIECYWNADIEIPLLEKTVENVYQFTTEVSRSGKVRQW